MDYKAYIAVLEASLPYDWDKYEIKREALFVGNTCFRRLEISFFPTEANIALQMENNSYFDANPVALEAKFVINGNIFLMLKKHNKFVIMLDFFLLDRSTSIGRKF